MSLRRILIPILLIALLTLGWSVAPHLQQALRGATSLESLAAIDCRTTDPNQTPYNRWPCIGQLKDGAQLQLSIAPAHTPPLTPLQIHIRYQGNNPPEELQLRFEGDDMYMGETPVFLSRSAVDPRRWEGSSSLAICTRKQMTWRATASLYWGKDVLELPFRFEARTPNTN